MFQYLLGIFIIINIITIIYPQNYFSELTISFLPYSIGCSLLGTLFTFVKLKKILKKNTDFSKHHLIWGGLSIGLSSIFFIHSYTFNTFYTFDGYKQNQTKTIEKQNIKILYANIHKNNSNYEEIKNIIKKYNPDLIMFVEFSENHYLHLKDFLKDHYPYINSTTRSKKFIGSMVFSKYKFQNRADNFPQGKRKYAYFSIKSSKEKEHYFYLVHTSSPDSYKHFLMRNQQLKTLIQDIQSHQNGYRSLEDKVIILGDFNVSPRSYYYKSFQKELGSGFFNHTRLFPIVFTRKLWEFPILQTHIDHLRSNNNTNISKLEIIKIPGSDHKGFVFEIKNL